MKIIFVIKNFKFLTEFAGKYQESFLGYLKNFEEAGSDSPGRERGTFSRILFEELVEFEKVSYSATPDTCIAA